MARRRTPNRRLSKRRWKYAVVVGVIALLILADRSGWLLVPAVDDVEMYHERTARVARVIDGDTIEVALPDPLNNRPHTRVRLWGLDCPELGARDDHDEPFAEEAAAKTEQLVGDRYVVLLLEPHQTRDRYGRVLAHVETPEGELLNRELLAAGLARMEERWQHSRLAQYEQAELIARRADAGVWAD